MRDAGIKIIPVDISEILKGWGALHCMTAFLRRDPVEEAAL
jgi:arginine deiminase